MVVNTRATVWYICYLDEEQEKLVRDYAKNHDVDLVDAVRELYNDISIDFPLYKDSSESDFCTEEIISVEDQEELKWNGLVLKTDFRKKEKE